MVQVAVDVIMCGTNFNLKQTNYELKYRQENQLENELFSTESLQKIYIELDMDFSIKIKEIKYYKMPVCQQIRWILSDIDIDILNMDIIDIMDEDDSINEIMNGWEFFINCTRMNLNGTNRQLIMRQDTDIKY